MRLFKLKFQSSPKYNLLEITSLEATECVSFRLFAPCHGGEWADSLRGAQRLFSVKYLFGEANIAYNFLVLEDG